MVNTLTFMSSVLFGTHIFAVKSSTVLQLPLHLSRLKMKWIKIKLNKI